ncbi:hypothetical protein [Pseudoalteromonas xiamenensis]
MLSPDELAAIALGKQGTQHYLTRINNRFQFQPKLGISLAQSSIQAVIEQRLSTPVLSVYESLGIKHPFDIHGKDGSVTSSDVEANAGDVVIHNVNLVHRSRPQTKDSYRRTIYFEFRKASHFETYPNFSWTWVQHRQLLTHCLTSEETIWQQAFTYFVNTTLYREPVRFEAGEYCYEPNATSCAIMLE